MPKIVISYRRSDSDAVAGRIRDRLAGRFGDQSIFMDIENIPFGTDFRQHIKGELLSCDLVLVIVGPKWLGPGKGRRFRIWEESDPVRIELETALQKDIPVVPVLVNGARMPAPSDLPESLQDFAFRNAAEVESGRDFHPHMDRLIRSLDHALGPADISPATPAATVDAAAVASLHPGARPLQPASALSRLDAKMRQLGLSPRLVLAAACLLAIGLAGALLVLERPDEQPAQPSAPTVDDARTVKTVTITETARSGCASDMPVPTLDEGKAPDTPAAVQTALTAAITASFRCSSVPFDRLAGHFASISIVFPLYVKDATCFGGDKGALVADWDGHKEWADRQGREDLLLVNLNRRIGQAIACLKPEEQRLFYVDVARAFNAATSREATHAFVNPTLQGQRIDRCLTFARECNEPAAFAWCRRFGYSRIAKWEWVYVSPTMMLGDGRACAQGCGAFSTIACAR
jgi:hypothetical protein